MQYISSNSPIGVFDSGFGGLTVLRELQRQVGERQYLYLGDNARLPYGTKSPETVTRYTLECAHFLLQHGVGALVVACNTASAAALDTLTAESPVPVVGTIQPAVTAALAATTNRRIAILATNATCSSGVYERALLARQDGLSITSQPCPLFVPLVETGMLEGEIVDKVIELYLTQLREKEVDTVILGCTHYPFLAPAIQRFLGGHVILVDCGREIARGIRELVGPVASEHIESASNEKGVKYFVTDDVGRFNYLATHILGGDSIQAERVEIVQR